MNPPDHFRVIAWLNEMMKAHEDFKEKLRESSISLARRKEGVFNLATRDLQQRVLNKITAQRMGIELNEKTYRLYLDECRSIRRQMSRVRYVSEEWIQKNNITDKESLKRHIRETVRKQNPEHFKEHDKFKAALQKSNAA